MDILKFKRDQYDANNNNNIIIEREKIYHGAWFKKTGNSDKD